MLHFSKTDDYLKILTVDDMFLTRPVKVEKYVEMMLSTSFDNCVYDYNDEILYRFNPNLQQINTKPMIQSKFQKLLNELKKIKVQTILVSECKKWLQNFPFKC